MKKKAIRLLAVTLAFSLMTTLLPGVSLAEENGRVHNVSNDASVLELFTSGQVSDGDTIHLDGSGYVRTNTEAPWVIDKNVIIEGGTLQIDVSGIVLNADVTFRNVGLSFNKNARNAIIANGHSLTLENVQAANCSFNLFCGSLIDENDKSFTVPAPGKLGTITITGKTNLQNKATWGNGNIYAGNLCMGGMDGNHNGKDDNGAANVFAGDAIINIESDVESSALGTVYACGAQQRIPVGQGDGKDTYPNASDYTVSGTVTISGDVPNVEGAGSAKTIVNYRDVSGSGYMATPMFDNISALSVQSGHLAPTTGGSIFCNEAALSVSAGAKLNISQLSGLTVGNFAGGGMLIMGQNQQLTVKGAVTETTSVAVGGANYDNTQSTLEPIAGQVYIQAPQSADNSFVLLPYSSNPNMVLLRNGSGDWTATSGSSSGEINHVMSFHIVPETVSITMNEKAEIAMEVEFETNVLPYLDFIPLQININEGKDLAPVGDKNGCYTYTSTLQELAMTVNENVLYVMPDRQCSAGTYKIQITIPAQYNEASQTLTDTVTLTVIDDGTTPSLTVDSIAVNSTGHKTSYTVGDTLDVTDLIIEVTYSDQSTWSIPVTADMVSGFDSGAAVNKQTLTIHYKGEETTYTIQIAEKPFQPGHSHLWDWSYDSNSHWQSCLVTDCGAVNNRGSHTAGGWVIDQAATATQDGSRSKKCTACGYVMAEETIPATGGGSSGSGSGSGSSSGSGSGSSSGSGSGSSSGSGSGSGSSSGSGSGSGGSSGSGSGSGSSSGSGSGSGGSSGSGSGSGGSSGSGSGSGSSGGGGYDDYYGGDYSGSDVGSDNTSSDSISGGNSAVSTQTNPDGSTTTNTTDEATGLSTSTTQKPDGSQTIVETAKDGTVTTTEKAADNATVKTVQKPDGSSQITIARADKTTAQIVQDAHGKTEAQVNLTAQAAQSGDKAITLPTPALPDTARIVLQTGSDQPVKVEIPLANPKPGMVAVRIHPDGTQDVVKASSLTDNGLVLAVSHGTTLVIQDNSKYFSDTGTHWAERDIQFVAARGLLQGTGPAAFAPDATMSRAMLMTVLARLDDAELHEGETWYTASMEWAVAKNISDGANPTEPITREQLATMLYRYAGCPESASNIGQFSDAAAISPYAREAMDWSVANGLLNGYGNGQINPTASATRAQTATILTRYLDLLNR